MELPTFSIIIPTKNEEYYLPKLLKSIKQQSVQPLEIIVADADSTDKTREIAKKFGCKIVKGGLPAVGRNQGGKIAKGEILVFFDADIILQTNDLLEQTIKDFVSKQYDIAMLDAKSDALTIATFLYDASVFIGKRLFTKTQFGLVNGAALVVKKQVFITLQGFNTKLNIAEDHDFIKRAKKQGYKIGLIKQKIIISSRRTKSLRTLLFTALLISSSLIFKHKANKIAQKYWEAGDKK